ncbi:MAG: DUF58 domain-containing protein [Chloroflexota bacterium]
MHSIFWALIVLSLVAVLMRMDWVYYLIYVVGGVWLFSHWWIRRSLGRIQVHRAVENRAFPGEILTAQVHVRNHSRLPLPWLHVQEKVPFALRDATNYRAVLSVPGQSDIHCDFDYRCTKRGYYEVGPLSLQTGDLFGFVGTEWQESASQSIIVYPQVVSLEQLGLPSRSPFGGRASKQRLFEDPARLAGVREYAAGDSMRAIHWKASAREGDLQVKKFQPAIDLNVVLVLDLNRQAYPVLQLVGSSEWGIVVAASIASHIIGQQRQQVGLITNGLDPLATIGDNNPIVEGAVAGQDDSEGRMADPIPTRNGRGHLMSILTLLARIQLNDLEQPLAQWLPGQLTNLEWGTTVVVVTPTLDEKGLWMLHNAYRRGSDIVVLLTAPDADFKNMQARGEKLGVQLYQAVWEKDLQAVSDG